MARRDCNFNTALIALANMPLAVQYLELFQFITLFHGHSIRGLSRRRLVSPATGSILAFVDDGAVRLPPPA